MTAVWYDPTCDQIWIASREEPFAPGTLDIVLDAQGEIHVRRRGQTKTLAGGPYSEFTDGNGFGFLSTQEALTYLAGVFARHPRSANAITTASGAPEPQVGTPGDLYLDAETGDLYRKET